MARAGLELSDKSSSVAHNMQTAENETQMFPKTTKRKKRASQMGIFIYCNTSANVPIPKRNPVAEPKALLRETSRLAIVPKPSL